MRFFEANLWEINKSFALRLLGCVLALSQGIIAYQWFVGTNSPLRFARQTTTVCWPMVANCNWVKLLSPGIIDGFYWVFVAGILLAILLFLFTRAAGASAFFLWLSTLLGFFLYTQDFRLSSNAGFLTFFLSFVYLLVPSKVFSFRFIIFAIYISFALLKLNSDWLSGYWILGQIQAPDKLGEWLAALITLIEFIAPATLLVKDGRYFWSGWATLIVYHAFMAWLGLTHVSYLFIGLLIFLGVADLQERKLEREYIYQSFIHPEPSRFWTFLILFLFGLSQFSHHFDWLKGQSRLSNYVTLFTPYPVSRVENCTGQLWHVERNGWRKVEFPTAEGRDSSMQCHPYLRFLDLKAECEIQKQQSDNFVTLAAVFESERLFEGTTEVHFQSSDLCHPNYQFSDVGQVKWNTKHGL